MLHKKTLHLHSLLRFSIQVFLHDKSAQDNDESKWNLWGKWWRWQILTININLLRIFFLIWTFLMMSRSLIIQTAVAVWLQLRSYLLFSFICVSLERKVMMTNNCTNDKVYLHFNMIGNSSCIFHVSSTYVCMSVCYKSSVCQFATFSPISMAWWQMWPLTV